MSWNYSPFSGQGITGIYDLGGAHPAEYIFGYPPIINFSHYKYIYDKTPVAAAVIDHYLQAWAPPPIVVDADENGKFAQEFAKWAAETMLWTELRKADKLALLGNYSVLLLRTSGELSIPMGAVAGSITGVEAFAMDEFSVRQTTNKREIEGYDISPGEMKVHLSRTIHIAHNCLVGKVWGKPALLPVFNLAYDYMKASGAAAHNLWSSALATRMINLPQSPTAEQAEDIAKKFSRLQDGIDRVGVFQGIESFKSEQQREIAGHYMEVLFKCVGMATGIPYKILIGTQEAKIAGQADEAAWERKLNSRRKEQCEANIIRPLINKLIESGTIRKPNGMVKVVWDRARTEFERIEQAKDVATIIKQLTDLMAISPSPELVMKAQEVVTELLSVINLKRNG